MGDHTIMMGENTYEENTFAGLLNHYRLAIFAVAQYECLLDSIQDARPNAKEEYSFIGHVLCTVRDDAYENLCNYHAQLLDNKGMNGGYYND